MASFNHTPCNRKEIWSLYRIVKLKHESRCIFHQKIISKFFEGGLQNGRGDLGQLLWGDMGQTIKGASNLGLLSIYTILMI